ncbi:MAG: transporter [candidate division NC10 bacterium]|nr:transporter [candidate division NC10 bacterium]
MGTTSEGKESGRDGGTSGRVLGSRDAVAIGCATERLLTSDFVFTTLANFANAFGMQMLVATLPVYVIRLGGSQVDAGLVSGAIAFTALLFRPLVGWLTDAWRRRPLVLIGTSCYGLASVVYLLAGSIPLLVLGRFVHGFGLSCYTTAANAYVADIAPLRRRGEAMGFFSAAQAVGLIVGPVIGFVLVEAVGFQRLFYFSGGLAFTAFLISLFARERRQPWEITRQPWSPRTGIVAVDALPVAWMTLCMGMGFGTVNAFIAIFAQLRGVQNPGFYFMVQAIALLVSRAFAGRLADQYGRPVVIVPGILLMAAALGLLPLAYGFAYFVMSASLFGLGFGTAQPATMALLIDRVRPEQRGLATSTYFTGFDAGISIGSLLLGMVSQHWGFGVMWTLAAACTLLGLAGLMADRQPSGCTV